MTKAVSRGQLVPDQMICEKGQVEPWDFTVFTRKGGQGVKDFARNMPTVNALLCFVLVIDHSINSSLPRQNGCHFADNLFICIFVNEKFCILITISLKFVPKGPIDNIPALVQIMVWRRIGGKPLSEPMLTISTDACMRHKGETS